MWECKQRGGTGILAMQKTAMQVDGGASNHVLGKSAAEVPEKRNEAGARTEAMQNSTMQPDVDKSMQNSTLQAVVNSSGKEVSSDKLFEGRDKKNDQEKGVGTYKKLKGRERKDGSGSDLITGLKRGVDGMDVDGDEGSKKLRVDGVIQAQTETVEKYAGLPGQLRETQ